MQFNIIQKVTMTCPLCNSSVTLNVPKNDTELEEMLAVSETLACPKCKEKFGGARKAFDAIIAYNDSTVILNSYRKLFNVRFEYLRLSVCSRTC